MFKIVNFTIEKLEFVGDRMKWRISIAILFAMFSV